MTDTEFDVSDGKFQDEFAELTKLGLRTNDFAVFASQCEKREFGVRALMVDRIIYQEIVSDDVPAEFAVLDHRFHAFGAQSLPK